MLTTFAQFIWRNLTAELGGSTFVLSGLSTRPFHRNQALHWLPVNFIITHKIAILTYKVKLKGQPGYLSAFIQPLVRWFDLMSSGTDLLHNPDCNLAPTNISRRAFSFVAPTIWNSLPIHLRSCTTSSTMATFIQHLKSYLFSLAFPMWSRGYLRPYDSTHRDWHMARYKLIYFLTYLNAERQ